MSGPGERWVGHALVALQLGLIVVLAWRAAPVFVRLQAGALAWVALVASLAVGAWALRSNRPGNFSVHPLPRAGGRMIAHGPYRWVRHPMYTSVALGALASVLAVPGWITSAWALALGPVLVAKALLEERWMRRAHPGYAAYMTGTSRFLPGL